MSTSVSRRGSELLSAQREASVQLRNTLRGVGLVRIEGTVTDAWAEYLEKALSASRDAEVVEFGFQEKAKEVLQRLEAGIEVQYAG
jgi:hypothetical protein